MNNGNGFIEAFIKNIDDNDIIITDSTVVEESRNREFKNLLLEYEQVVVKSLITSFGLDFILFKDKIGGDVQTTHNARNNVFTEEKYKKAFYENYERKNYEDKNAMISFKKELFKKNEKIFSGYTNRQLKKDGSTHTEHILSAGEYHRNDKARLFQSNERRKEVINNENNFTLLESNINQSKGDQNMEEFLNRRKRGEEQANSERFGINREQATGKYNHAKNYINRQVMYDEIKHYSIQVTKKGSNTAVKMGLRQCLGIIFAELWIIVRQELPNAVKELKENFKLSELHKKIADIIKKAFINIKIKYKELLASFKDGVISGFLTTLSSTVINIFFTTAKNVGRILRQSWASIVESIKILMFNPDNVSYGEQIKAVAKIISTCISVICGSLLQEVIVKITPTIPVLSEVLPIFVGTMVTGIINISLLYFIDNSEKVKKIVEFLNQFKSKTDVTLDYYKEVNKKLNNYVANLLSIDFEEFESEIEKVKDLYTKLSGTNNLKEFSNILYNELNNRGVSLQFTNFEEFDEFMMDKDAVLII